jgi:hypothetical protein
MEVSWSVLTSNTKMYILHQLKTFVLYNKEFNVCTICWFYCLTIPLFNSYKYSFLHKNVYITTVQHFCKFFLYFWLIIYEIPSCNVLVQKDIFFQTEVVRFIEFFLKEKAWWWPVISRNLSPNRLKYCVVYDCILGNIYYYNAVFKSIRQQVSAYY